jgi:hypothetical protein
MDYFIGVFIFVQEALFCKKVSHHIDTFIPKFLTYVGIPVFLGFAGKNYPYLLIIIRGGHDFHHVIRVNARPYHAKVPAARISGVFENAISGFQTRPNQTANRGDQRFDTVFVILP